MGRAAGEKAKEDYMKEDEELEGILCKGRKGERWRCKGVREDFMKGFEEFGKILCKRKQGENRGER